MTVAAIGLQGVRRGSLNLSGACIRQLSGARKSRHTVHARAQIRNTGNDVDVDALRNSSGLLK